METYNLNIKEEGVFINEILINDEVFQEEKCDYTLRERKEQIDSLIDWISETDRQSDLILMKEDLKYLINCKDEYIFSSISTNEYILKEDNLKRFNKICKEILELHKTN